MMINRLYKSWAVRLATLDLSVGTPAAGTIAAILVSNLLFWLHWGSGFTCYSPLVPLCAFFFAVPIISRALPFFDEHDPALICLDEVVGMWFTLCFIDLNWLIILTGFLLFRFFDIMKPLGIKLIEKLPGVWGILLDDVAAGLLANLVLRFVTCYLKFGN